MVGSEDDSVVVNIACKVNCVVGASFGLQAWDSIDREYISIGSVYSEVKESYETDVLLTLVGELNNGLTKMEIEEIEVADTVNHADFGEI